MQSIPDDVLRAANFKVTHPLHTACSIIDVTLWLLCPRLTPPVAPATKMQEKISFSGFSL